MATNVDTCQCPRAGVETHGQNDDVDLVHGAIGSLNARRRFPFDRAYPG